jgi:hypothetical protein
MGAQSKKKSFTVSIDDDERARALARARTHGFAHPKDPKKDGRSPYFLALLEADEALGLCVQIDPETNRPVLRLPTLRDKLEHNARAIMQAKQLEEEAAKEAAKGKSPSASKQPPAARK